MNKSFLLGIFLLAFCCLSLHPVMGVQKVRTDSSAVKPFNVSIQEFEKYYSDKNFNYRENVNPTTGNLWWMKLIKLLTPIFSSNISSFIIYAIFIGIFILLIIVLLGGDIQSVIRRNRKISTESVRFEEESSGSNIDEMIRLALKDADYTKAIRLMYIKILKILDASHLINWQKEKTNHDYRMELINTKYHSTFSQITLIYEYTWYGKFTVTQGEYAAYERKIHELKHLLDEK